MKTGPRRKKKVTQIKYQRELTSGIEENDGDAEEKQQRDTLDDMIVQTEKKSYELNMHVKICVMRKVLCVKN